MPEGYKASGQGDLQIQASARSPGAKRSAFQQGLYTALQAKFGKIFQPEIKLQGFHFAQGRLATAGQFVPNEIISQNGWLAIGYAAPRRPERRRRIIDEEDSRFHRLTEFETRMVVPSFNDSRNSMIRCRREDSMSVFEKTGTRQPLRGPECRQGA